MILHPARIFSHRLGAVVKSPIKPVYYFPGINLKWAVERTFSCGKDFYICRLLVKMLSGIGTLFPLDRPFPACDTPF